MKYLKLCAHFQGARDLAECLIGSKIKNDSYLLGISEHGFMFNDLTKGVLKMAILTTESVIEIPLDSIKFCPHIALKNTIRVKAKCMRFGKGYCGVIGSISLNDNSHIFFDLTNLDGEKISKYGVKDIALDISRLPNGCEIIEVKE